MTTVSIPSSLKGVTDKLGSLGELIRVREWEKAALVAAFVRLEDHGGRPVGTASSSRFLSTRGFAELGIVGLRSKDTVRLYVQRWLDVHEGIYPEPGAKVTLPDLDWPPTRTGTDGYESTEGAEATIEKLAEKHPEVVARAARKPVVAEAIAADPVATGAVIDAGVRKGRSGPNAGERNTPMSPVVDELTKLLYTLGATLFVEGGKQVYNTVEKRLTEGLYFKPKEVAALIKSIDEALRYGEDAKALLTPVSDQDLAKLLAGGKGA